MKNDDKDPLLQASATKSGLLPPPENPPKTPATEMALLREALATSLMPDDRGAEMLKRQLATLDALFGHMVGDYATKNHSTIGYCQSERLGFALRLQQQCVITARALSAMDYMRALTPTPLDHNEQKEDGA